MARAVAPGNPHHVTQRGNRRCQTFFSDEDYLSYLELMPAWCEKHRVETWAYCLMPNHIHLIVAPETKDGLRDVEKINSPSCSSFGPDSSLHQRGNIQICPRWRALNPNQNPSQYWRINFFHVPKSCNQLSSQTMHKTDQFSRGMAWAFMARKILLIYHG